MLRKLVVHALAVGTCSIAILCGPAVAGAQTVDAFNPDASQIVEAVAVQPDGKILVGGNFTMLGGVVHNHIARLNVDGTVDSGFTAGANATVHAVAVQPDGKILVGGNFTSLGVGAGIVMRSRIGRFNANGTVDAGFNPGASTNVHVLLVQPDGKILVGGEFTTLGGGTRRGLGRLNANGSLDSFDPGASKLLGAVPIVKTMALQLDGKIVVGGYFNGLGGGTGVTPRNFIGRIDANGIVDAGFDPGANSISGVDALAIQSDGNILVAGSFTGLGLGTGVTPRQNIGRVDINGAVDAFNPGAESQVLTLSVQADGRILVGGYFTWLGAAGGPTRSDRNYIGRLNANGSVDETFNPGAGNVVNAVAVQPDGAVVAGGIFVTLGGGTGLGTPRNRIGRITNPDAGVQTLTLSGGNSVVTWARGGGGPEVSRVTFEKATGSGAFYTLLGTGTRVAGGWELTGLSLPTHGRLFIRARGYYGAGFQNGSGSIVESVLAMGQSTTTGDFDGDGRTDITVYRPSDGNWFSFRSGTSTLGTQTWGISTDTPVHGDYDGDGNADIAVFRPSSGTWYILQSSDLSIFIINWGAANLDVPVPKDYDGDGKTDIAVFRPNTGEWFIRQSNTLTTFIITWGVSTDVPAPADYDGDGKADIAVFRPGTGVWYIFQSSNFAVSIHAWGGAGTDVPVSGDYDGDGKADIAIYRPASAEWFIRQSNTLTAFIIAWGISTDIPVPADYDGDGRLDIAVFRPGNGTWYILQSGTLTPATTSWGISTDIPIHKRP